MKKVFGYNYGKHDFEILQRGHIFYLYHSAPSYKTLELKTDNISIAKAFIDGYIEALKV